MYVYIYDTGRSFTAMTQDVVYSYDTGRTFTAMTLDVVYSYDTGRCLQLWHCTSFTAMTQDVVYSYGTRLTFTAMTQNVCLQLWHRTLFTAMTQDVVYSYDTGRRLQLWHKTYVYSYDTGRTFTAMRLEVRLQLWHRTYVYSYDTGRTFTARTLDIRFQSLIQRTSLTTSLGLDYWGLTASSQNNTFQTFTKRFTEEYLQRDATLSELESCVRPINKMLLDNLQLSILVRTNDLDLKVFLSFRKVVTL